MPGDVWARQQWQCFQNPIKTEQLRPRHVQQFFSRICGRRTGCLSFQNTCTSARTRLADGTAAAEPEKDRCAQLSPNATCVKPLVVTAIINAAVASANR